MISRFDCQPIRDVAAEELGAETEMFYSQFELSTREQKICEIKLVQVGSILLLSFVLRCFHTFVIL